MVMSNDDLDGSFAILTLIFFSSPGRTSVPFRIMRGNGGIRVQGLGGHMGGGIVYAIVIVS
jgi:hypothetical protein